VTSRSSISGTSSFKAILVAIRNGACTMYRLAELAGMPEESLRARLVTMECLGLVEWMPGPGPVHRGGCAGCPVSRRCDRTSLSALRITDRGRSILA